MVPLSRNRTTDSAWASTRASSADVGGRTGVEAAHPARLAKIARLASKQCRIARAVEARFRVYSVDVIGHPGLSAPSSNLPSAVRNASWSSAPDDDAATKPERTRAIAARRTGVSFAIERNTEPASLLPLGGRPGP